MQWDAVIHALVPDVEACRQKVADLRAAHPGEDALKLADRAITQSKRFVATEGALTGLPGNPFAMVPMASLDLVVVLRQEAKLAGTIAALLEPNSLHDEEGFRADVLAIVFPNAVSQALREVAAHAGRASTKVLIRKYISKGVLRTIVKYAARYLGIKVTQRAIITKTVPLVGAAIGGFWNWQEVRILGKRAVRHYTEQSEELVTE